MLRLNGLACLVPTNERFPGTDNFTIGPHIKIIPCSTRSKLPPQTEAENDAIGSKRHLGRRSDLVALGV
jgi:hypothetical protein